ncbi:uncharacterized protein LOC128893856 [Hylaeus anthracinus]|uniref:uncharacterized protein LOC128893856 n=1 Tax=Hylaeus anthracinus TaxID=313031 RepID=UPI0023B95A90|nr:uncharacterized protein LOC128893856 [Hylaeus anthracinus]XP_054011109.1 uncharacterized protein LOC128893856 [Hylaeus anthracinus]XP_054011110.1 uncharacterized protein LOC128893856 [Hylaeus anthracinus]XP_054011111.1 uncharacterized protein LOC128893856 [Hylaeus anthracinus]XP_054011113.1 uncharacterized protein LOC128893856 [Hylaeus anthracinus]
MQRVLSFQMARGFGESSEFVTKRMCFSFIFSVGFICILCGFLLGRFSTQRIIESHAERKRLELAGNGLESTEYLQHLLLEQLDRSNLDEDFEMNWESFNSSEDDVRRAHGILSNLSFIQKVVVHPSCIVANARGSREPDRYVVVSASGEGVGIALELAKKMSKIQREYGWRPRRSLIFCLIMGSSDPCLEIVTRNIFLRSRIMAYVIVHQRILQGRGPFTASGSDVVKSVVFKAASTVKNIRSHNNQLIPSKTSFNNTRRLAIGIPHAELSFINNSVTFHENNHERQLRKIILAQILSQTIWRLSECLIMKWNPRYFNETVSKALELIDSSQFLINKDKIQEISVRLLFNIKILNGMIDAIDSITLLDTRILNDLMMDLDRALLCSDTNQRSRTDWVEFFKLDHEPFNVISTRLNEIVKCYETAVELLQNK